jgi:hypothetical protein
VGSGLVHVISDGCMNDGGVSNQGDSLLIYCCDSTVRVCLSGEACPWGGGCGTTATTCSRSGLPNDYMANAGCEQWRGRGNYYCSPTGEIYFP